MGVGLEADQRAEGCEDQRQRNHQADEPGRHVQFDDHHAVERAGEQHHGHADRDLEQRQAQQAAQRQFHRRRIGEGQEARPQHLPALGQCLVDRPHARFSSWACEI